MTKHNNEKRYLVNLTWTVWAEHPDEAAAVVRERPPEQLSVMPLPEPDRR